MRPLLKIITVFLLFVWFLVPRQSVEAACGGAPGSDLPGWGTTVTLSSCNKTITGVMGVDWATTEASTTNTGALALSGTTTLTINSGGELTVGSLSIGDGTTIALAGTGKINIGTPLYIADADADGWSSTIISSATLYTATASGRRRLALMRAWTSDCGDSSYNTGNTCSIGDGADGAVTISADKNINTDLIAAASYADGIAYRVAAPADSATSVARYSGSDTISNGIAAGDEVLLINLQGTSTDYADVGNYEFMTVSSITSSTITFTSAITKSFDGTTASNQSVVVQRVPNFTDITINANRTLTASTYESLATTPTGTAGYLTGIVAFRASGTVTVTGTISTNAKGYPGGTASSSSAAGKGGQSFCGTGGGTGGGSGATGGTGSCGGGGGAGSNSNSGNNGGAGSSTGGGGGGGGVAAHNTARGSGGGAGGGYGSATNVAQRTTSGTNGGTNTSGTGGAGVGNTGTNLSTGGGGGGAGTYGSASLTTLFYGSGGGSGGASVSNSGAGGAGGGMVYITGATITITGGINSNGGTGGDGATSGSTQSGGGGGGAGGSIYLIGTTVTLDTSLVTASAGGAGSSNQSPTAGGSGRIAVGATSSTGTTSPTFTAVAGP